MLTIKQLDPVAVGAGTNRPKKIRALVELDASDYAAFLELEEVTVNEVHADQLAMITRWIAVEGS